MWSRSYCVSTIGIDEERIREYVKWQEKKEQEMEQLQGELFDEAEDQPVVAHLLGRKNKATASGGGHFTFKLLDFSLTFSAECRRRR